MRPPRAPSWPGPTAGQARARIPLLLALVLAASPGCLYIGGHASVGPHLSPELVARLQPGQSTKADVIALLGPPNEYKRPEWSEAMSDDSRRTAGALALSRRAENVFTYQYDELDFDGTVLLLLNIADVEARSDMLVVFFDENDVVIDIAFASDATAP